MRMAAIMLVLAVFACGVIAADKPPAADKTAPVTGAGVLTDVKPDFAMIWVDGDDASTKFAFGEGFDKTVFGMPPKGKAVLGPDRVQFTYTKSDDGNKLLAIKKAPVPATGTVTGEVLFSNNFWVAVKPKGGLLDGYAVGGAGGKDMSERLMALKKGDLVTIKFHTDVERHRIDTLAVLPPQPISSPPPTVPAVSKPPTSRPEAATSQPTVADSPAEKLKLVQMYLDSQPEPASSSPH